MGIPTSIQAFIDDQAANGPDDHSDLRAVIFNGTLKRSPEPSQTDGLLAIVKGIMERAGARVDEVRTADHEIPPGVWPDMTEHGYDRDEFPEFYRSLVVPADILILSGPIWLGDQSFSPRLPAEANDVFADPDVGIAGLGISRWQLMSGPHRVELAPDLETLLAPLRRR